MIKILKIINTYRLKIITSFKNTAKQVQWRLDNKHNLTVLAPSVKNPHLILVGKHSYGQLNVESFENPEEKLVIGDFVSIGSNVVFILGGNHQINTFTTFPIKSLFYNNDATYDAQTKGPITVEDEVWIGTNVTIMSGVTIGKGSIIAAGSLVVKDVDPFSIVGGNPAKFVKFRIDEALIPHRLKMPLNTDIVKELSTKNLELLYQPLSPEVLQKIKNIL